MTDEKKIDQLTELYEEALSDNERKDKQIEKLNSLVKEQKETIKKQAEKIQKDSHSDEVYSENEKLTDELSEVKADLSWAEGTINRQKATISELEAERDELKAENEAYKEREQEFEEKKKWIGEKIDQLTVIKKFYQDQEKAVNETARKMIEDEEERREAEHKEKLRQLEQEFEEKTKDENDKLKQQREKLYQQTQGEKRLNKILQRWWQVGIFVVILVLICGICSYCTDKTRDKNDELKAEMEAMQKILANIETNTYKATNSIYLYSENKKRISTFLDYKHITSPREFVVLDKGDEWCYVYYDRYSDGEYYYYIKTEDLEENATQVSIDFSYD